MTLDEARPVDAAPARLAWSGHVHLPDTVRERLMGPGARFELTTEEVFGEPVDVFARAAAEPAGAARRAARAQPTSPVPGRGRRGAGPSPRPCRHRRARRAPAAPLRHRQGRPGGDRRRQRARVRAGHVGAVSVGAVVAGLNGWWTGPSFATASSCRRRRCMPATSAAWPGCEEIDAARRRPGRRRSSDLVARPAARRPGAGAATSRSTRTTRRSSCSPAARPAGRRAPRSRTATSSHFANAIGSTGAAVGAALVPPDRLPRRAFRPAVDPVRARCSTSRGCCGVFMSRAVVRHAARVPAARAGGTGHAPRAHRASTASPTWSGVPTQYWRLLAIPTVDAYDLTSLRTVGSGGAPFPPELIRRCRSGCPGRARQRVRHERDGRARARSSVGPVMAHHARRRSAPPARASRSRSATTIGKVARRGRGRRDLHPRRASVFLGYWDNPEATAAAFAPGRWYRTGDFGRIEDGMLLRREPRCAT